MRDESADSAVDGLSDIGNRPTLPPPFDLEQLAREKADDDLARAAPSDRPTQPAPADPGRVGASALPMPPDTFTLFARRRLVVPRVVVPLENLCGRRIDPRAAFLLSCVDGASNLEALLDVSAMSGPDALTLVAELVSAGILRLDGGEG